MNERGGNMKCSSGTCKDKDDICCALCDEKAICTCPCRTMREYHTCVLFLEDDED